MIDKQCKGLGKIALHWSMNRDLFNTYKWQIFNSNFITNFCRTRINRKQVKRRHDLILTALQTMWVLLWKKYWYLNVQIIYHCELYQLNISSVALFNIFVGGKNIFSHRLIDRLFVLLEKYRRTWRITFKNLRLMKTEASYRALLTDTRVLLFAVPPPTTPPHRQDIGWSVSCVLS